MFLKIGPVEKKIKRVPQGEKAEELITIVQENHYLTSLKSDKNNASNFLTVEGGIIGPSP